MDRAFYFDTLYPLQDQVLKVITAIETGFYLTGGTASSRGQHATQLLALLKA
jgi:hypothetical protein